jgi:hypothetical protein
MNQETRCPTCGGSNPANRPYLRDAVTMCNDPWHSTPQPPAPGPVITISHGAPPACTGDLWIAAPEQTVSAGPLCGKKMCPVAGGGYLYCNQEKGHEGQCTFKSITYTSDAPTENIRLRHEIAALKEENERLRKETQK